MAEKEKPLKLYFCPKCKSKEVGYVFTLGNIYGIVPRMKCKKCEYRAAIFPVMVISPTQLKKIKSKYEAKMKQSTKTKITKKKK